ncbi:GTPase-activating protein, partial [Methylobacterium radiotolerans]
MQGLLSDLPLLGVLELIHATRQTGVLDVQARVPFTVAFLDGE